MKLIDMHCDSCHRTHEDVTKRRGALEVPCPVCGHPMRELPAAPNIPASGKYSYGADAK